MLMLSEQRRHGRLMTMARAQTKKMLEVPARQQYPIGPIDPFLFLFCLTTLSLATVGVRYHCGTFPERIPWDSGLRLKKLGAALPLRPS